MTSIFDDTPEELDALRTSVADWLKKARQAVTSFHRTDKGYQGTFWRDSTKDTRLSITTTARSYMALAYAERQVGEPENNEVGEFDWREELKSSLRNLAVRKSETGLIEWRDLKNAENGAGGKPLNNFELAHFVDFVFVRKFISRFSETEAPAWPDILEQSLEDGESVEKFLRQKIAERILRKDDKEEGQIFFDSGHSDSRHFFVTLHTLRALNILEPVARKPVQKKEFELAKAAEQFCIEQCFYCQRGIRHLQDPARLVFASAIYCMHAMEVDRELMLAVVETIATMQEPNGKWPTTHPISRASRKIEQKELTPVGPWYIASPELGLSLTWLYFQPALPEAARDIVVDILQSHFQNWLVPTYRRATEPNSQQVFYGWYDDSSAGHDKVVGWTTAIVCHFLANFHAVLNDFINRRVIESLNLQAPSQRYLIDETAYDRNPRWSKKINNYELPTWPDLPPFAWSSTVPSKNWIAKKIAWNWTDPTCGALLSERLSRNVLLPIQESLQQRPGDYATGILDGPPGTRKTSLVKVLAEILEWPYIPVPASVIFEQGFDMMETRATEVFQRLNYLNGCIIFFDEFEEFFKDREEKKIAPLDDNTEETADGDTSKRNESVSHPSHDRTIAAFTTSAMLPRLQDLHDQKHCLIFLATNHFEKIDEAIVRPGRFDFRETIGHPTMNRFKAPNSYFLASTERELKKHDIPHVSEEMKIAQNRKRHLKQITEPVRLALNDPKVLKNLRNFYDIERKEKNLPAEHLCSKRDCPSETNLVVRFSFVEAALSAVSKKLNKGETDSDKLKTKAVEALINAIEPYALVDESGERIKGPQTLPPPHTPA